jgi:hypothetical protein
MYKNKQVLALEKLKKCFIVEKEMLLRFELLIHMPTDTNAQYTELRKHSLR